MSKLQNHFNNPIDVVLEKLYSPVMPCLHKIGYNTQYANHSLFGHGFICC